MRQTLSWSVPAVCLLAVLSCQSGSEEARAEAIASNQATAARVTAEESTSLKKRVLGGAFASPIGIGAREVRPPASVAPLEVAIAETQAQASLENDVQALLDDTVAAVLTVCMDALASSYELAVVAEPDHPFTVKLDAELQAVESIEIASGDEMVTASVGIHGESLQMIYSPSAVAAFEAGETDEHPPLVMADGQLLCGGTIERSSGLVEFCGGSLSSDGSRLLISEGTELCFDSVSYVHDGDQWVLKTE